MRKTLMTRAEKEAYLNMRLHQELNKFYFPASNARLALKGVQTYCDALKSKGFKIPEEAKDLYTYYNGRY